MAFYPTSKIQEQFLIINKIFPDNPAYNMPSVFKITGRLNLKLLKNSVNMVIEKHHILRTSFKETVTGFNQFIEDHLEIKIPVIDLMNHPGITDKTIDGYIQNEISAPFDLDNGPLLRLKLFQIDYEDYVLTITIHHIITDLYSKTMLAEELSSFYNQLVNGNETSTDKSLYQYYNYSESEKIFRGSVNHSTMLAFWKDRLKDSSFFLNFPVDHSRPEPQFWQGAIHKISFSVPLAEKIKKFSRENSVNIFVTTLTIFYILLFRYTRQHSVIVGLPMTNRRDEMRKCIMGCMMNILPLKVDVARDDSLSKLITFVRRSMLEAHRNQEVPILDIISQIKPPWIPGVNPIYQAGFAFEPPMEIDLTGVKCKPLLYHNGGAQLELFMTLWETDGRVEGRLEFNRSIFETSTISNIASNFIILTEELINNPDIPIENIPMKSSHFNLPDVEAICRLGTNSGYDSINAMIEEQAIRTPEKIAARFKNDKLTYRELNERSNQLAHYLRELGTDSGSIVGIFINRSIEMLICLIAVHKAGCAYLPLDPEFPSARIDYMIRHSRLSLVLSESKLSKSIPTSSETRIIPIDTEWPAISSKNHKPIPPSDKRDDLAYVMYTSGSTGNPKGVQITHRSVINFLTSMRKTPGISTDDILLAVTTISFDISVLELFLPLISGAELIIIPKEISMDGRLLIQAIEHYQPTVMQATPTTWKILFSSNWEGSTRIKALCGGEAMPRDLAIKLVESASSTWNMYGPTETTVWSTCFQIVNPQDPIYLGKPIDNTYIYILDENLQHVPDGVVGEIYIGGAGVARGYLFENGLTAERFISDPFIKTDCKIYKTGDTGRFSYNGFIEFFGRADSQVKVRGHRIELTEIEFHINQSDDVTDSAVSIVKDNTGSDRLIGYIVPEFEKDLNSTGLRQHLQERVPGYMIPELFVKIQNLPLIPNGKIDRKSLPVPDFHNNKRDREIVLPVTHTELKLTDLWRRVLANDKIGVQDNFFDLGGNSLLAIEIINLINREFNSSITVLMLFKHTTISSMARYLSSAQSTDVDRDGLIDNISERKNKFKAASLKHKALKEKL